MQNRDLVNGQPLRAAVAAALVVPLLLLGGCAGHKEERTEAMRNLADLSGELSKTEARVSGLDSVLEKKKSRLGESRALLSAAQANIDENKDRLAGYLLEHKAAAASLGITLAGVLEASSDDSEESRKALGMLAAVGGGIYCGFNAGECSDVAAKSAYYAGMIALMREEVAKREDEVRGLESNYEEVVTHKDFVLAERAELRSKVDSARFLVDSLACKGIVCL